MSEYPYEFEMLFRIFLASICGSLIGYERERHGISAGLRTNILVCVGSALIMVISKYFYYKAGETTGNITVALDPARIAAQIVTGIGFLGAGVIIKDKGSVRGLTTAATLWFNAGVGMALGAGMLVIPAFCTIIGLVSLAVLKKVNIRIPHDVYKDIIISCNDTGIKEDILDTLVIFFNDKKISIENIGLKKVIGGVSIYRFTIKCDRSCLNIVSCIRDLSKFTFITKVKTS